MHIHQLNVSHNDRQDRLLMRLNTQTGQEYRFWLTRRMVTRLLPVLGQTLGRLESGQAQVLAPDTASRTILTDLKRDEFLTKADFKTPFVEQAQELPMGDEPMLVTDVQLQLQGTGVMITLEDKGATDGLIHRCELHLQTTLVHGLVHLLEQAVSAADWLGPKDTGTAASVSSEVLSSGYRH